MKSKSKWLEWTPGAEMPEKLLNTQPSKPSKPHFVGFEGAAQGVFSITRDATREDPSEAGENRSPDLKVPVNQTGAPLPNGRRLYPPAAEGPGNFVPGTSIPLPLGVRVIRYTPVQPNANKGAGITIADPPKIIKTQLADLDARLNHPVQIRGGGSVFEILAKLAEVGLELAIERPRTASPDGLLEVVTEGAQPAPEPGQIEVACSVTTVDQASPEIMEKTPDHAPSKPTQPGLAGPEDAPGHSVGMGSPRIPNKSGL